MKYKKLLLLPLLSLLLCGCSCSINLYDPYNNGETTNNTSSSTYSEAEINVINTSNFDGTFKYADTEQSKLSSEEVYNIGITSTVYVITYTDEGSYLGSGVFFSEDTGDDGYAYLFTNAHVVDNAINIEIIYSNYKRDSAKLIGYHLLEDVAVLAVEKNTNYTIATLKTSDMLEVASEVLTIGTPISTDYNFSSTKGIISRINSPLTSTFDDSYNLLLLQIDAALNSGNSGGPLFDMYGNLIGLNTMKILYDDNYNEVYDFNFSIPIERAIFIAKRIFSNSPYNRGLLGITISDIVDLSLSERTLYGINLDYGLYVFEVASNGASKDLLMSKDVITKINGKTITNKISFQKELYNYSKNEQVTLTLYRNGTYMDVSITLK